MHNTRQIEMGPMSQLNDFGPELGAAIAVETSRHLELIASENYTSAQVMQAPGYIQAPSALALWPKPAWPRPVPLCCA